MLPAPMSAVSLGLGQKSKAGTSVMEIASRSLRNHLYRRPTRCAKPVIRPRRREVRRPSAAHRGSSRSSRPGETRGNRASRCIIRQFPFSSFPGIERGGEPRNASESERRMSNWFKLSLNYFNPSSSGAALNPHYRKFVNCGLRLKRGQTY